MSDPIEPDDPDARFHAAWLAQLSEGADGLVSKQAPKHDGGNTSVSAISSNPAVRLVGHDVPPPQLPLGRRSGLIVIVLIGLVFALVAPRPCSLRSTSSTGPSSAATCSATAIRSSCAS